MKTFWEIDKIRLMPPNAMAQDYHTLTAVNKTFFKWLPNWAVTGRGFSTVFLNKLIPMTTKLSHMKMSGLLRERGWRW